MGGEGGGVVREEVEVMAEIGGGGEGEQRVLV